MDYHHRTYTKIFKYFILIWTNLTDHTESIQMWVVGRAGWGFYSQYDIAFVFLIIYCNSNSYSPILNWDFLESIIMLCKSQVWLTLILDPGVSERAGEPPRRWSSCLHRSLVTVPSIQGTPIASDEQLSCTRRRSTPRHDDCECATLMLGRTLFWAEVSIRW